jgi:hypothetical protein
VTCNVLGQYHRELLAASSLLVNLKKTAGELKTTRKFKSNDNVGLTWFDEASGAGAGGM